MPFWVNDYRTSRSVRKMTFECKGLYLDMIFELWADGHLDNDEKELAKLFNTNPKTFRRLFSMIKERFVINQGKITHKRVDAELAHMIAETKRKSEINRDNAKKGWEKRRARNADSDAPAMPSQYDTDSYSDTNKSVEGPAHDPVINNCSKPVDKFEIILAPKIIELYSEKIKFAASNTKNHHFVEMAIKDGVKAHEFVVAINTAAKKYKIEKTPERFRKGVETFFESSYIRHVNSEKFEIRAPKQAPDGNQTPGEEWLSKQLKQIENTGWETTSKLNRKDAIELISSYIERWRWGLKPDLAERWLKSLINKDKASINKGFDLLIKKSEKPFTFQKLIELSRNYEKENESRAQAIQFRKEREEIKQK